MAQETANYYSVIIAILSTIIAVVSLVVSWKTQASDKYNLKNKYQLGIMLGSNSDILHTFTITLANNGKRPVTIQSIEFIVTGGKQMVFFNNEVYMLIPKLPIRLDENESYSINYDLKYLVEGILEKNESLELVNINTQDGKSHKIKIGQKGFNNMKRFLA